MERLRLKNEINWMTVIPFLVATGVMIAGWVWWVSAKDARDQANVIRLETAIQRVQTDFTAYVAQHAEVHRERAAENAGITGRLDARITAQEDVNASYRLPALEANFQNTNTVVNELKTEMSELRAEQRLTNQRLGQIIEFLQGGNVPPRSAP